jgi:predicted aldo/keto reductase-like oxidoreductase
LAAAYWKTLASASGFYSNTRMSCQSPESVQKRRSDLKEMQTIRTVLGEKFCHRCEYCMPCEQGVQIPSVLIFQAAAKRLAPEGVSAWLGKAMESVSECIECGQCEEKCPYNLPVADLLKENLALFKKIEDTNDLPGT